MEGTPGPQVPLRDFCPRGGARGPSLISTKTVGPPTVPQNLLPRERRFDEGLWRNSNRKTSGTNTCYYRRGRGMKVFNFRFN